MIKMMAAVCRRPGMTHGETLAYVQHVHGAISNENPLALRRYVQNHVFDAAFGSGAEAAHSMPVARDSVTELWWDNPQEMGATFAHEHVRTKVGPDAVNFGDVSLTLSLVHCVGEMAPRWGVPWHRVGARRRWVGTHNDEQRRLCPGTPRPEG